MPTISQSKDIIYLLTHTADWAAGRRMFLHYKALITSLSFPFRTILGLLYQTFRCDAAFWRGKKTKALFLFLMNSRGRRGQPVEFSSVADDVRAGQILA